MSNGDPLTDSARGYLSQESKRRFTLVAGILGAVFFVAQFALPMLIVFLIMVPMMAGHVASVANLEGAALWNGELWFVEQSVNLNWRDPERSATQSALKHVRLTDLSAAGPSIPLGSAADESSPTLLPLGGRLWVIGSETVAYYENVTLTRLGRANQPPGSSRPFVYQGLPAVISRGTHQTLATLRAEGGSPEWTTREFALGLPPDRGSLRTLQAVEADGRLHLFAELCTEEPTHCSLNYREAEAGTWLAVAEADCSCMSWTAVVSGSRPAVVISERERGRKKRLALVTIANGAPQRKHIEVEAGRLAWSRWRALPLEGHLVLVSEGMPGSLSLAEVADGHVVRSVRRAGSFPFGPGMVPLMVVPQLLPALLSLILALVLTGQMRRHRVQGYAFEGTRRAFASLWQRALAQLVDLVPLGAGFLLPLVWIWRFFSDPESLVDSGPLFPLWILGLFAVAFVCALLVLVAFSYLEGRFGKTPGKWLLGIRVLGTDLKPCGFGRALLRNLLTFVDGFFNFLVGALLVALTENWQRLGDLAARTIVVTDERPE